jgi:hypothetical protein
MKIVDDVVIVGGGSSAWLTAAFISHQCPELNVTVVDKQIGTPIGVGEGTLLSFDKFMQWSGFDKLEWFHEIDATYKTGALFPNWVEKGHDIWHPFNMSPDIENMGTLQQAWSHNQNLDFKYFGVAMYDTAVNYNKIDTSLSDAYGYHVDAGKLVTFIQRKLENRVKFVPMDVTDISYDGENIDHLILMDGRRIYGDVFIDCTGFRSILRNPETLDRVDLAGRVFTNTALCAHVEYEDFDTECRPYTRAEAVQNGWIWTIPTQSRMGSGIIFNNKITTEDEAAEEYLSYWNGRVTRDQLRLIDWTPYYNKNPWYGNTISIGMSAGFIEPLESTGLALIQHQAYDLSQVLKSSYYTKENVKIYNDVFTSKFEECVDFVSSHYSVTNLEGKFWDFVRHTYKHTEGVEGMLKLLETRGPRRTEERQGITIFSGANWTTWAQQMGYEIAPHKSMSKELADKLLNIHINTTEKYRFNWSSHHATEIRRSKEYNL